MGEEKSESRETLAATSLINQADVDVDCDPSVGSDNSNSNDENPKSTTTRQTKQAETNETSDDVKENNSTKTNEASSNSTSNQSNGINGNKAVVANTLNDAGSSCEEQTTVTIKPEFKISIVPLEKLLAQPSINTSILAKNASIHNNNSSINNNSEKSRRPSVSVLPARSTRNKNVSIIELSESEYESADEVVLVNPAARRLRLRVTRTVSTSSSLSSKATSEGNAKRAHRTKQSQLHQLLQDSDKEEGQQKRSTPKLRHCVVRVKRVKLPKVAATAAPAPTDKSRKTVNTKRIMSSDSDTEQASTSKRRRQQNASESDSNSDDSDYKAEQAEEQEAEDEDEGQKQSDEEAAGQSSDSEIMPQRKRRSFAGKKDSVSGNDSSDFEPDDKKKKKRRRIKKDSSGDSDDGDDEKNKNKRKHIRKIIKTKDLDLSTKEAAKEEDDRRKRIEERQKLYNRIFVKSESVEISELILDFDEKSKKALLQVDKGLLKKLKPHQVAGVRFMWEACFETLKESEKSPGSGCILAHCMGLGKTLQVVTLSHTLLTNSRRTGVERVLVISPLSTVNNWAREFVHWMGFAHRKDIEIYDISRYKDKPTRIFKLNEWYEEGGVCILGYDMYRILANEKAKGLRKKQREQLQQALVDPGPDMVVCDEGHLLKNEKTSISKAVTRMRTKRRIVLTGTPLQNNLKEYYCMIQFVKPNLLGTYKEYMNRFVNPISNGQYTDSTERDLRLMKHRSHILHKLLEGCIQRRDYSVLAPYLPPKHEYVVYTTLSELQQQLYGYYMTTHRDQGSSDICGKGARLFQDFQDLRRIWTHPMNLRVNSDNVIAKRLLSNDDSDIEGFICDESDEEEAMSNSSESGESFKSDASLTLVNTNAAGGSKAKSRKTRNGVRSGLVDSDSDVEYLAGAAAVQKDDPSEWWKPFVEERELNNVNHSPKLLMLLRLLQQCEAIGDKLLVFSQSLQSLDVIEHFLSLVDSNTKGYEFEGDVGNFKGCWSPGEDYFRLDGSCSVEQREAMCKKFNNATNLRARLFLISTRAGGLGINLVAANRVVIFDVSWNPSHDTQSIFRVYRFGQVKPCYIYRLIAMGTMEQKVYERQVAKQATAKRVIDEQQISRHYNQTDLMELYTYELKPSVEREMPLLPKDRLFAELLTEHEKLIFKYHEHDSLLEQEEHENLTEEERKSAWAEYEAEKTRAVQASQYMSYDRNAFGTQVASQFGNASGSVTSNKIFGFRSDILLQLLNMKISKDHPELTQNQVIQLVPSYLQQLYNEMNNGDPTMYKDLLQLHTHIVHPSGMYMNPLLYANQNPSAAGYNQASTGQTAAAGAAVPSVSAQGFEADKVYEID
ncbi:XNP [Drosophila busckii]|uniref:DNA helicase n=1 Tax=Drosophila busckii TaxID=30019 RepID=A0A0M4F655_DROBS|nr:transcriptional regulator ATRX homolog [Drosophila busckii]ALC47120.1 XNP [Drosophila busckii]